MATTGSGGVADTLEGQNEGTSRDKSLWPSLNGTYRQIWGYVPSGRLIEGGGGTCMATTGSGGVADPGGGGAGQPSAARRWATCCRRCARGCLPFEMC